MRQGKLGRWLTYKPIDEFWQWTVPESRWLLLAAERAALRGCHGVTGQASRTAGDRSETGGGEAGAQTNPPADVESKGAGGEISPPPGGGRSQI
eukprot:4948043-Pyramimonas_sp.AAC.1